MLSKEEIEKDNTFKISMPLITDEDIRKIDKQYVINKFTNKVEEDK